MDPIPIILVHCSTPKWPHYALLTILQTKRLNVSAPFHIITDAPAAPLKGIEIIPYSDFDQTVNAFHQLYFHMSGQPFEVERQCIARWFIIRDLMRERGYERCFCMDSDVFLFNSVAAIAQKFADVDYAILSGSAWSTTFINRRSVLEDYCDLVTKAYQRDPDVWPEIAEQINFSTPYKKLQNLTDMGFIYYFTKRFKNIYSTREQAQIIDGALIDPNLSTSEPGMEMYGNYKKIEWVSGFPHAIEARTGKLIRLDTIHFQGTYAKGLMQPFFDRFTETWEALVSQNEE